VRYVSDLLIWWKCVWSFYQSTRMRKQLLYIRTYLRPASQTLFTPPQCVIGIAESSDFFAMWSYLVRIQYGLHDILFPAVRKMKKKPERIFVVLVINCHLYLCISIPLPTSISIYLYIYIYLNIYTYIYIYIYIYLYSYV
jgi:hypothetical protein